MAKGPTVSTTFNAKDKITGPMKKMRGNMQKFGKVAAVAGAAIATGIGAGISFMVKEASKIEDITAAFTPLLGSVGKANELVDMLNQTAATTPFQLENIAESAQQLLPAMNGDLDKTIKTFRMLGDTAGGSVEKLNRVSAVYSRVLLKNKLETGDLNILTERGIPIYKELSESMGVSVEEMAKMATQGKITGADLTKVFEKMTSEGGVFFNGMDIASATLTGRLSTLKDNIALTAAGIGKTLLPVIKPLVDDIIKAVSAMREWVTNNEELIQQNVGKTIERITKAIRIFVRLWEGGFLQALAAGVIAFKLITGAIMLYQNRLVIAAAAQAVFNAVVMNNPIGLIIMGIALLIAGIVLLIKNWEKVKAFFVRAWHAMVEGIKNIISWFSTLLDNKFFVAAGLIFAPWLTIPAMIIKHWEPLMEFFKMLIEKISLGAQKVGQFFGGIGDFFNRDSGGGGSMVGRNDAALAGGGSMNSSQLAVNFNNAPAGTSFVQKGSAPGITVDTGRRGGL